MAYMNKYDTGAMKKTKGRVVMAAIGADELLTKPKEGRTRAR
jgi:hypothetical protein